MYEARATQRESGEPCLYFRVDDHFADPSLPARGLVVKVTFANYQNGSGSWTLEYDGDNGWTRADTVAFKPDDVDKLKFWTATFNLPAARLANGGPEGTDLAIRALTGTDAAFLLLRVIRTGG